MSENDRVVKIARCPVCYMKEIDEFLTYDERDGLYYCRKCCFEGTAEDTERVFEGYLKNKYPKMG